MTYPEYGEAAKTHYKSCRALFNEYFKSGNIDNGVIKDVLYRIYYLCGHIVECAAIYFIYRHFEWEENPDVKNWKGIEENIKGRYNRRFTMESHMHYDQVSVDKEGYVDYKNWNIGKLHGGDKPDFYDVKTHDFPRYIKGILWEINYDIPYFRQNCSEDEIFFNAIELLDKWKPDLRYYYEGRKSGYWNKNINPSQLPEISKNSIENLLNLCELIVSKIRVLKTL